MKLRHRLAHDHITRQPYAVALDARDRVISAWMHADGDHWEAIDALDGFGPLEQARKRGEFCIDPDPDERFDQLGPSVLPN